MCDARDGAVGRLTESGKCYIFTCCKCRHRFGAALEVAHVDRMAWDVLDANEADPVPKNWKELDEYRRHMGYGDDEHLEDESFGQHIADEP